MLSSVQDFPPPSAESGAKNEKTKQITFRVSGFELDFNVEAILNSLIFQIEIVNEVGMANKSYREVYI